VVYFGNLQGGVEKILNHEKAFRGMVKVLCLQVGGKETLQYFNYDNLDENAWSELNTICKAWVDYFNKEFVDLLESIPNMPQEDKNAVEVEARRIMASVIEKAKEEAKETS
jgi:hypothetical protein